MFAAVVNDAVQSSLSLVADIVAIRRQIKPPRSEPGRSSLRQIKRQSSATLPRSHVSQQPIASATSAAHCSSRTRSAHPSPAHNRHMQIGTQTSYNSERMLPRALGPRRHPLCELLQHSPWSFCRPSPLSVPSALSFASAANPRGAKNLTILMWHSSSMTDGRSSSDSCDLALGIRPAASTTWLRQRLGWIMHRDVFTAVLLLHCAPPAHQTPQFL